MHKKQMLTVRMDKDVYEIAKAKSEKLGMPLATLVRIFLKSFTTQKGIGFYVGDEDLTKLINLWVIKKKFEKLRGARINTGLEPKLRDIFEL